MLVQKVINFADIIGVTPLINEINKLQKEYYAQPTISEYSIIYLCDIFKLTKKEFLQGSSRTNKNRYNARAIYTYISYNMLSLTPSAIGIKLNCSIQQIYNYNNYIEKLNNNLKQDSYLIAITNDLQKDIKLQFFNK